MYALHGGFPWSKWYDRRSWLRFGPAFIIGFFVAGIVLGAVFIPNIEWGGGIGGVVGILALAPFAILFGINTRRPLFRLYLKSKDFSLVPVNDQVRVLLSLFKSHGDT